MDNSHSEQEAPKLKLSDLRKIHNITKEIAQEIQPNLKDKPTERRKLHKKIWNKLIPNEKQHKKELAEAVNEGEIDLLTQVYNNRGFTRRWQEEISRLRRAKEDGQELNSVLLYVDANMLKQINDEKGHKAGDEYLKNLALVFKENIRPTDIIGRIGGDEFAIILQKTTLQTTRDLIEKRIKPKLIQKGVSVSIGAEIINFENPEESRKHADEAMYEAKRLSKKNSNTTEYKEYAKIIK